MVPGGVPMGRVNFTAIAQAGGIKERGRVSGAITLLHMSGAGVEYWNAHEVKLRPPLGLYQIIQRSAQRRRSANTHRRKR